MTKRLGVPPACVSTAKLNIVTVRPSKLVRVSSYITDEPYFGHSGAHRFDAPGCPATPQFSSCYFGLDLTVAIAESVLHDRIPEDGAFPISSASLGAYSVLAFTGKELRLADLTGAALKRLDGNADLAGHDIFDVTQQWSLAVYNNPDNVDGFIYMSRHQNTGKAVILFDRAAAKVKMKDATQLTMAKGFEGAALLFNIIAISAVFPTAV